MDKLAETEIVDYIYESMVRLMLPVTKMPQTFIAFITPLYKPSNTVNAILPFGRDEFERVIRLLFSYEPHSNPIHKGVRRNYAISLGGARRTCVCRNSRSIYDLYNFLTLVDDEYIAYLKLNAVMADTVNGFKEVVNSIRFKVSLGGFDIVGAGGKIISAEETQVVRGRWAKACSDGGFYSDFSMAIDKADLNLPLFSMDYTVKHYTG